MEKRMEPIRPVPGDKSHFMQHLMMMKGSRVKVKTDCNTVRGVLKEVMHDYIIVVCDGKEYLIRQWSICYVRKDRKKCHRGPWEMF